MTCMKCLCDPSARSVGATAIHGRGGVWSRGHAHRVATLAHPRTRCCGECGVYDDASHRVFTIKTVFIANTTKANSIQHCSSE